MANMTLTKARTILESPKEYTPQEVKNAKKKVANPEETIQANKGTLAKKKNDKVMVVSIGIGSMKKSDAKKMAKAKMANGGMAYGKPHMYSAGGEVKMNPGLKALAKERPDVVKKILGKK